MPLTFAHPAAILPFSRKSKYINFSAMVIGSMAPDFEYFLRGQPGGEIGHTFLGFLFFNLPLVALIYLIYHYFIHQTLLQHLPIFLQDTYVKKVDSNTIRKIIVFVYSSLFGMLTHVVWDSFTHVNGVMVMKYPIFAHPFTVNGFTIPLFKFLQHGGTMFGITLIFGYMFFRARGLKKEKSAFSTKQKMVYWSLLILLTLLFFGLWIFIDIVPITSYGKIVVRIIDSAFMSLLLGSMFFKYRIYKSNS